MLYCEYRDIFELLYRTPLVPATVANGDFPEPITVKFEHCNAFQMNWKYLRLFTDFLSYLVAKLLMTVKMAHHAKMKKIENCEI